MVKLRLITFFVGAGVTTFVLTFSNILRNGAMILIRSGHDLVNIISLLVSLTAGLPVCFISSLSVSPVKDLVSIGEKFIICFL